MIHITSRLRFATNALAPINQLPPEILCEVFLYLRPTVRNGSKKTQSVQSPFGDLLAITHTCKHWRTTATNTPDLWSQLIIRRSSNNLGDLARLFIRRSGELPLDADVRSGLTVLLPYVDRLRTLRCLRSSILEFPEFCNSPAQSLETLHILSHPGFGAGGHLPALFNGNYPSLRELDVNEFNPFTNNFRGLSSFRLQLSSVGGDLIFWAPFFVMLQNSPQLEELFLRLGRAGYDNFPPIPDIPTPVPLRALQRLHIYGSTSTLARGFMNSVDLPSNGIATQFTNIQRFDWMSPPTFPLDLSFHAMTSLEIINSPDCGFVIQGATHKTQIRVVETSNSDSAQSKLFSILVPQVNLQLSLRELWIHTGRAMEYRLPPFSEFPHLEKLVVRATTGGDSIRRLLEELGITGAHLPCPLLSTLDLSGRLNTEVLGSVLKTRSEGGCRLQRLRLGNTRELPGNLAKSRVLDYVDELDLFDVSAGPRGMELPAGCTTDLGELWQPWTNY